MINGWSYRRDRRTECTHGNAPGMVRGSCGRDRPAAGPGACDKPAGEQGTKGARAERPRRPSHRTKPAETKPAETKPAETKPADQTKPAWKQTHSARFKPASRHPLQTEPLEGRPERQSEQDLQVVDAKIGGQAFKLSKRQHPKVARVGMMERTSFPDNTG